MEDKKDNQQIVSTMPTESLIQDLRQIIDQARGHVAATANYAQTMMYWHIGERINRDVLGSQRAEYGKQIVAQVARQLQKEYGKKGFDDKSIRRTDPTWRRGFYDAPVSCRRGHPAKHGPQSPTWSSRCRPSSSGFQC